MMTTLLALALQSENPPMGAAGAALGGVFMLISFAIMVAIVASVWKVFTKAGQPGWAAIIPIYNLVVFLKIAGKPLWWLVLCLIPGVNFIAFILIALAVAKNFGKGAGFGIGLALLSFIFFPILGFGSAQYRPQP
jgi:hypothetical protein